MAAVEATLNAERARCQEFRMRLERQTHEHQVALTNAEERLLNTHQELDKVRASWPGVSEISRAYHSFETTVDTHCARNEQD